MAEILARVKISEVYYALTGKQPRRVGSDAWRGAAVWRGGDGLNVSLNDTWNVWHDFTANEGGGVLDLVVRIRGCSRQDALRWLADFTGIPLDDRPLPPEQRQQCADERRRIERYLPVATVWRRAMVKLVDELLDSLKGALFDPTLPWPEVGEIYSTEKLLSRLQRLDGGELVATYLDWTTAYPATTAGLVNIARAREKAERRALLAYLKLTDPQRRPA
jgi:hypothetical protein